MILDTVDFLFSSKWTNPSLYTLKQFASIVDSTSSLSLQIAIFDGLLHFNTNSSKWGHLSAGKQTQSSLPRNNPYFNLQVSHLVAAFVCAKLPLKSMAQLELQ